MKRNTINSGLLLFLIVGVTACAFSPSLATAPAQSDSTNDFVSPTPLVQATETSAPMTSVTKAIPVSGHTMEPVQMALPSGKLVYDVRSSGNAAPYGDTYKLNRLERPFSKDMTYVPDLDIVTFNLSQDADWYYVSIELSGKDPNDSLGINYGVEIDLNADGFGDYILWAHPPYTSDWSTSTVQVYKDSNHDTGGLSSLQADSSSQGNGYDTLVFDGSASQNEDPDLAWVRMNGGPKAIIQLAFKRSLIGSSFMLGVVSDGGVKDLSKFDYNDHFNEADAGSPERNKNGYPLKALYAVDSTCWEAYGMTTTGYEPKLCQIIQQPTPSPAPVQPTPDYCYPEPTCPGGDPHVCGCTE